MRICFLGMLLIGLGMASCRSFSNETSDTGFAPPSRGLQLHYSFDARVGNSIQDRTGQGRDAQLFGGATRTPNGIVGGAVSIDGQAGSYIEHQTTNGLVTGFDELSLSVWIKSNHTASDAGILIGEQPTGRDRTLTLRYDAFGANSGGTNLIKGAVTIENLGRSSFESRSEVQSTLWQHLVLLWQSGSGFRLYIDAERIPLAVNPVAEGVLRGSPTFLIGKGAKDIESSWDGRIDELLLYDRVLTEQEIQRIYENGFDP